MGDNLKRVVELAGTRAWPSKRLNKLGCSIFTTYKSQKGFRHLPSLLVVRKTDSISQRDKLRDGRRRLLKTVGMVAPTFLAVQHWGGAIVCRGKGHTEG